MKANRFSAAWAKARAALFHGSLGTYRTCDEGLILLPPGYNGFRVVDGDQSGAPLGQNCQYTTHDGRTVTLDSTGAFLVGELERLDQTLHMPLAAVSWQRDIDLRTDVTVADEMSSFTLSTFGAAGSLGTGAGIRNGKAWIDKTTDQIGGIGLDIAKVPNPLNLWGMEIKYSVPELMSAARAGRPVDAQKYAGMQLKYQMDVDEQVYVGDASLNVTGLVNSALVTNVANVPNGAGGFPGWKTKTPNEILTDVNEILNSVWQQSGFAEMANKIGLPPQLFGYLTSTVVSSAGNQSIMNFLLENNILKASGQGELEIVPMKWLIGAGSGGTLGTTGTVDRMILYRQQPDRVRFPLTMLQRTPLQYESIYQKSTYWGRIGVTEVVYPETIGYRDGI